MLNIVHLFNHHRAARYPLMISEGLLAHPDVHPTFAMPVVSFGRVLHDADPRLHNSLLEADYIFRPNDEHFNLLDVDAFLDKNDLWKKVVYYDLKDSCEIDSHRLDTCHAYIKRSWTRGYDREPMPEPPKPILPMDYGLLHEYFDLSFPHIRDIDVACLFPVDPVIGKRRFTVVAELLQQREHFASSSIGSITAGAKSGRRAIYEPPENNPFLSYLQVLRKARIVFTAFPDPHDGDSRTWEAFSSGAMVFMDRTTIPSPHPFVHKEHCFVYDARDRASVLDAIEQAKWYLKNESERQRIALNGFRNATDHHKPVDRMKYILKWVQSKTRILSEHVVLPR